jgi:polar amino acid transport system substrate-binding protein
VDFGVPMMKNTETFLVRADETRINGTADLKNPNIIVATQNGTTNEITAKKLVADPNKQVKVFDTFDLAVTAVVNKQADVVVIDTFAASGELGSDQFKGKLKLAGGQFGDEVLAWVFQKGDTELENAVNAGLKAVFKDGTYTKLCTQYWKDIDPKPDCSGAGLGLDQL